MILLLTALVTLGAHAQLLYKISGNGLTSPSYIFGTEHLAPVSFVDSVAGLRNAMAATQQVYGEVLMSEMTNMENMLKMQQAMMMPDGKLISDLLTSSQLSSLCEYMKEVLGEMAESPMVKQQMLRMKPSALTVSLQTALFAKRHPDFNFQDGLDKYFQDEALKANKTVGGLETIDDQINALFNITPLDRQTALLMCLVENKEDTERQTDNLVNAYMAQDLDGVQTVMDERNNNSCDPMPEEENILIYNRNANWMQKMPSLMSEKSTLFVVGAGHLPTDRGLLQLLRNAGYTVEGVK